MIIVNVVPNLGSLLRRRPAVPVPVPDGFNKYVGMDLIEVEKWKVWILHLIDVATRNSYFF